MPAYLCQWKSRAKKKERKEKKRKEEEIRRKKDKKKESNLGKCKNTENKTQVYSFAIQPSPIVETLTNQCITFLSRRTGPDEWLPHIIGLTRLLLPLDQLSDSLLDNFPPIQRFPHLVRSLVHNIPIVQVLGQMGEVSLFALPLAVGPELDG